MPLAGEAIPGTERCRRPRPFHGRMILSIYSEPDPRVPRIAVALARFRQQASRSVAMLDWTSPKTSARDVPRPQTRRSTEVELNAVTSRYQDVVIDVDDLFSPAAMSAWIGARMAVIALSPAFALDTVARRKLIARLERGWLFNPRLKTLLLPVCLGTEPSAAHLDVIGSFTSTVPCIHMVNTFIHDIRGLKASVDGDWDDGVCRELAALWSEIDAPAT
jgi:hypothetical protein